MLLPITLTFAGAAALINLWLAFRVIAVRRAGKVLTGDGANPLLLARMRAQANFVEYAPFVLILLGLIELSGGAKSWLWGAGFAFVAARIIHPFGLDLPRTNVLRSIGALVTWVILLGLGLWGIWIASHAPAGTVHYF